MGAITWVTGAITGAQRTALQKPGRAIAMKVDEAHWRAVPGGTVRQVPTLGAHC